jgi:nucleoid DNA-binding protein
LQAALLLTAKIRSVDITPFIRELILLNECVILRGFGGFDTEYKHATFDKNRKIITPPGKKVSFRPDWVKDNRVLEQHIARSLKIKPEKASEFIDTYVDNLFKKLSEEGTILLEGVGTFKMVEKDKILFIELENENYLADSFGLDILKIEIEALRKEQLMDPDLKSMVPQQRKHTGWYVAIGLLLLFIMVTTLILLSGKEGISVLNLGNKKVAQSNESEIIIFGQQNKALEDSVIKTIEQTLDKKTSVKNALALNEQEKSVKPEPTPSYLLIAGSFKSAKNADVLKVKLLKKGYNPEIMITRNNYTMVVVGTFKNKNQAFEELNRIRRQLGPSVWLLEK